MHLIGRIRTGCNYKTFNFNALESFFNGIKLAHIKDWLRMESNPRWWLSMYSDLVVILAEVEPALVTQIEESLLWLDIKGMSINFRSGIYVPFISGEKEIVFGEKGRNETLIMELITSKDNIDSVLAVLSHIFEQTGSLEGCLLICTLEEMQKYKPLQFVLTNLNN